MCTCVVYFFKQKTAYEMRISDWSSDVCSSDLEGWPINRRMLGIYRLQGGERRYARLLHHWLNNARDGDLLICHPGLPSANDMSAAQRLAEYEVLRSEERRVGKECVSKCRSRWPCHH